MIRWLVAAIAIVSGAGLAVELLHDRVPEQVLEHLSLSYEGNVPTWLSSSLLLGCAIAAGVIAREATSWRRQLVAACAITPAAIAQPRSRLADSHVGTLPS